MAGQQDRPSVAETTGDDLMQRMERLPPGHPSSPYDEDGSRKPPVARHADRELPLPDEQSADAESASQETRHGEIGSREVQGSDPHDGEARADEPAGREALKSDSHSWQEALPQLKEQWQRHEERWPQEQRPQVDRSNDEPGSWRGDSGRALRAHDNARVDASCDLIAKAEARISIRMEATERTSAGGLTGREFRLKGRDRLKDKVAAELTTNADADVTEVVASVHDGVRYTLQYDDAEYTSGVQTDVERMKNQGFELMRLKNLWNDADYKGINSQWHDEDSGQAFEVQFHTPASFEAKQITHKAYERLRSLQTTEVESGELHDYQREVSSTIPIPIGAPDLPEYP